MVFSHWDLKHWCKSNRFHHSFDATILAVRMFCLSSDRLRFKSEKALLNLNANVAKLAYAKDLKSFALKKVYRFKSDHSHQKRLDVRVAKETCLLNKRRMKNLAEGSNPSPAAILFLSP